MGQGVGDGGLGPFQSLSTRPPRQPTRASRGLPRGLGALLSPSGYYESSGRSHIHIVEDIFAER